MNDSKIIMKPNAIINFEKPKKVKYGSNIIQKINKEIRGLNNINSNNNNNNFNNVNYSTNNLYNINNNVNFQNSQKVISQSIKKMNCNHLYNVSVNNRNYLNNKDFKINNNELNNYNSKAILALQEKIQDVQNQLSTLNNNKEIKMDKKKIRRNFNTF